MIVLTAETRSLLRGLLDAQPKEWFISGCPICPFVEHTTAPRERCPNDGMPLARFDGKIVSWEKLEAVKAKFRPDPVLRALSEGIRGVVRATEGPR